MSGLSCIRLLLLLWGCLWLTSPTSGALVIFEDTEAPEEMTGAGKLLQKRSTNEAMVEVHSVTVDCTVTSRFAHTVMTSVALNKASTSKEIFFEVELPKTAFITNFSMEIEGKVYVGAVKEKEKAKKQYEKAVSTGQTAGLVKASGRNMEKFSVSVNIAAESNVTFILTYEELLQRKLGEYEILIRVKPKSVVQQFQILTNIFEPQGLSHVDAQATFLSNELLPLVEKKVQDQKAQISFSPTMEQQRKCPGCDGTLIDGDFIIKYDVKRPEGVGEIQIVNGYFVHFFAPQGLSRMAKNVVFVIDRSGSMQGRKMAQTRDALVTILEDLHEDDHFALLQFDTTVLSWKKSLTKATKDNVTEAKAYARQIRDNGGTDINTAVLQAIDMLIRDRQANRLPERSIDMIILLTDGMPNSGESHIPKIQENVRSAIGGNMSLFCLGFGNDVDYNFLDVMSKQNKGLARRIFEASDATLQLQGFYDEVSSPLLLEVDFQYPDNGVDYVTTSYFPQLFNGSEIVVAGQLMDNDLNNFLVNVLGQGFEENFNVQGQANVVDWNAMYPNESYIFGDFTERLWAYLTIQQLLEKSKTGTSDEKVNATAKALEMSLQYSFVTPLTSMVVTKPETEDGTDSPLIADKLTEAQRQQSERLRPMSYSQITPSSVQYSRNPVYLVDGDPHFIIELPGRNDSLCFNINNVPGTIFNLVRDPESGVFVNGQIIGDKKIPPNGKINTYFWRFGIVHQTLGVRMQVTTQYILISQDDKEVKLLWTDAGSLKGPNVDVLVTKDRSLTVTLKGSVKFVILLHKVWKKHPYHRDYLGFYTLDTHLLSPSVHGLLGQFYHGIEYEVTDLRPGKSAGKPDATMFAKGQELNVTRGWQRDYRRDVKNGENVPCWFIHNDGLGLIDGAATDYIVSSLFTTFTGRFDPTCFEFPTHLFPAIPAKRTSCFLLIPMMWLVLLLWICVCISPPTQVQGALVVSRRDGLRQDTREVTGPRSIKKRSINRENVEVYSVRFACTVTSRFARTVMTSKALNKVNASQEIGFEMELPKTAFITNFSMEIDGRIYAGEVKEKEKAKKQYEKAVSKGQSAGLVKVSGRKMEKFSMSVNVAAGSSVTFVLIYEELLQRTLGQYEILTRVKVEKPMEEFQIAADIYEPQGIAFVEATATFLTNELQPLIEKTITGTKAYISFSPTAEQQRCPHCPQDLIDGDFIIKYDVKREKGFGEIQVVNGYFVHFFSPPDLARVPKNVVFVIDKSGSMEGTKIVQTRDAMVSILKDLHEDDHFGIIQFDNYISNWKGHLTRATKENVSAASRYVREITTDSATDIHAAVLHAVSMLKRLRQNNNVPERSVDMIILLTDGNPNSGETDTKKIQENVRLATAGNMSLFCLGFGNDVDYSFLDVLSRENKGIARRIFEGSDAVVQLKGFYEEVSSPLLSEVDLRYPDNAVSFLTKNQYSRLFSGSEIVVAGQLNENDMDNFLVEVSGQGAEGDLHEQGKADVVSWDVVYPEKEYIFGGFTERLWAYLTIQQLLEKSDISTQQEKDEAIAKALNISLQYSFVTPLTSMVVIKPETEDTEGSPFIADKLTEDQRQQAERRQGISSPAAIAQGLGNVDGDPHFIIELPDQDDALCFNINDKPGTIYNLVRDQKSGFVVNGQIIGKKKFTPHAKNNTYFGHFAITHKKLGVKLDVSTDNILVFHDGKHVRLQWSDTTSMKDDVLDIRLTNSCSLTVTLWHSVKFMIIRHTKIWKKYHDQQDYLGFYTLDSHHLSSSVHGLIGQFYHGVEFELTNLHPGEVEEKSNAIMYIKGQTINVTRHWEKDFSRDVKTGKNVLCWFVNDDGNGLIDGAASDYTVPDLFTF
ncbi:inter-alpha-trypsin inhibitor heavy chain H3a [Anableps anableps]